MQGLPPVVFVGGFGSVVKAHTLGAYWGLAATLPLPNRRIFLHVGPFSSVHDRACEVFYQLKGGRVDYGEEHSRQFGHERFSSEEYAGEYPEWSEENPVHLVGHSLGGCTIIYLLGLLEKQCFPGYKTSARWVRSITTISSPLRGTTACYVLGAKAAVPGGVNFLSPGSLITRVVHLWEWLDIHTLRHLVDLNLSHFQLSRKRGLVRSLSRLLSGLTGSSPIGDTQDNAAFDLTIEGATLWHRKLMEDSSSKRPGLYPSVYYMSFAGSNTEQIKGSKHHWPRPTVPRALYLISILVGRKRFPREITAKWPDFNEEEFFENDGLASTISQFHPFPCGDGTACQHRLGHLETFPSVADAAVLPLFPPSPSSSSVTVRALAALSKAVINNNSSSSGSNAAGEKREVPVEEEEQASADDITVVSAPSTSSSASSSSSVKRNASFVAARAAAAMEITTGAEEEREGETENEAKGRQEEKKKVARQQQEQDQPILPSIPLKISTSSSNDSSSSGSDTLCAFADTADSASPTGGATSAPPPPPPPPLSSPSASSASSSSVGLRAKSLVWSDDFADGMGGCAHGLEGEKGQRMKEKEEEGEKKKREEERRGQATPPTTPALAPSRSPPSLSIQPGIWHVHEVEDLSHFDVAPFPIRTAKFHKQFFEYLFDNIKRIDAQEEERRTGGSVSSNPTSYSCQQHRDKHQQKPNPFPPLSFSAQSGHSHSPSPCLFFVPSSSPSSSLAAPQQRQQHGSNSSSFQPRYSQRVGQYVDSEGCESSEGRKLRCPCSLGSLGKRACERVKAALSAAVFSAVVKTVQLLIRIVL